MEWEVFVGLVEFACTGDYAGGLTKAPSKLDIADDGNIEELGNEEPFGHTKQA